MKAPRAFRPKTVITYEMFEKIADMAKRNYSQKEIENELNIGSGSVSVYYRAYYYAVMGMIEDLKNFSARSGRHKKAADFALQYCGYSLPTGDKPLEAITQQEQDTGEQKNGEQIVHQIDRDQIARIMYALGNISDSLEKIASLVPLIYGLIHCETKNKDIHGDDIVQLTNFFADYARQIREDVRKLKGAKNG